MSLLPLIFYHSDLWRGQRLLERNLLDDLLNPSVQSNLSPITELQNYFKNLNAALSDTGSTGNYDKDKFQANFDVQHFRPEEICVKVKGDNEVTIECKHEEEQDELGYVYRHFVRKYTLPKNCDISKMESKLSSDGVLFITAPKVDDFIEMRSIPIIQTGKPVKSIERHQKPEEN